MSFKVLHLSSGNLFGGVETVMATLARERACAPELEPHFALCFPGRLTDELAAAGTPATMLGAIRSRYPWQVWQARRRLAALLKKERFDAVICHMPWALAIFGLVVKQAKIPLVFWMHDAANGKHWIERWASRCTPALVIANSHFTLGTLPALFKTPPSSVVIYCPVSAPAAISRDERATIRAALGVAAHQVVILQVGRMEPYKGHAVHLEALAALKDLPDWTCWIAGGAQRPSEASYLAQLQAQAAASGISERVKFLGQRSDVFKLLASADIFCQPNTRGEPFGLVYIEALYAGLPVVATAAGGALEIVDESCGKLVPPGEPAALSAVLDAFVRDAGARARGVAARRARAESLCGAVMVLGKLRETLHALEPKMTVP